MILSQVSSRTKESRCSCEDCDSADCFSKRNVKQICSCELCYNSQTCLFPRMVNMPEPIRLTESDLLTSPCHIEPHIVIEPDISKTRDAALNATVSFNIEQPKVAEKVNSKPSVTAKHSKPSKIPISTNKIFLKSYSITKTSKRTKKNLSTSSSCTKSTTTIQKNPSRSPSKEKPEIIEKFICKSSNVETPKVISDHKVEHKIDLHKLQESLVKELIKKEVIYVYDRNRNTRTITTKESKVSFRNIQADNYADEESIGNSLDAKYSNKDIEFARSTARLAAQIMNMPYTDFKSESKSSILQQVSKYPIDIFKRIKEAYKACSCKVCECIVGKPIIADDICKCKPCECSDCKRLTINVLHSNLFPVDNDGCACIRCDRKDCKGITSNKAQPRVCDCQVKERETKFEKGCDCEPCQCIECSLKRSRQPDMVIARVEQNYLNSMCDCSPCECADCIRGFGISNEHVTTSRREMSTGVNRHPQCQCEACITEACVPDGNELCWCVRQSKVMSKPFQRDTPDYDIRRANLSSCFEPRDTNRNDTLTMYASITNTYPQKMFDYKEKCSCDPCECLVCNHKTNRESRNVLMEENVSNYTEKDNGVQDQMYSINGKNGEHSNILNKKNCGCNFCDCENCKTRETFKDIPKPKSTMKMCLAGTCGCSPCECLNMGNEIMEDGKPFCDCQQFLDDNDFNNQPVIPPPYSTFRNTKKSYLEIYEGLNDDISEKTPTTNHIPTKDREEINFYENYPYNGNCSQINVISQQGERSTADAIKQGPIKEDTYFKELTQSPSVNSSISCLKDSGSLSPISRNKKKSAESSCNSSGHDYPDYLIHFPKTTVQKCIDDVMKSNFMNPECLKINYMNKPSSMMSTSYKNIKYKPIPSPPLFRQQNNETPRAISDNCSFTTLSVVSKHTSLSSKSSLHRTSGVISIETTSKKGQNIENDANVTDSQKLTMENNSPDLEDLRQSVNENEVTKIKKHVTVNPMHDDFERVQNTLTEAREFSKHLVQLLEKYETANKTFDVYKKNTDNPTCSDVKLQNENKHSKINFKKDTDLGSTLSSESQNDIRLKKSTVKTTETAIQSKSSGKLLLENNQSKSSNSIRKAEDDKTKNVAMCNENILPEKTNKYKVSMKQFNKNDVSVITEPAYIFKKVTDNNIPLKPTKSSNVQDFLNTIAEEKVSDILSDVYKANSEKRDKELRKKRNFNYMYKRTMTMSKKMNIMPRHENVKLKASVVTEESNTTPQGTKIKRNAVYASKNDDLTEDVSKENKKSTYVNKNSTNKSNYQDKTDKIQTFVVIKSPENKIDYENAVTNSPLAATTNYDLDTESNYDLDVDTKLLNLDFKEALQSIPLEPESVASNVHTVFRQENKALVNLQSEVKKLLDMPLLQPFMEKINDICNVKEKSSASKYTECCKIHTAEKEEFQERSFSFYNKPFPKNKYNSLKVRYVDIRQVSDDSVVVKWDAPQNINHVEGYEVLVDGKSVHKILNPNKCNAVVTGLTINDNDKILLSIRTVTNIPNIERMPATTVIYRPQEAVY